MNAHTHGPWFVFGNGHCVGGPLSGETAALVAMCAAARRSEEENEANARLVAAAPDLFQVAQDFAEVLSELDKYCECGEAGCRTTRLRAALAKVRGAA